ncbi:MAG: ATP-grasp domain-containing protein [Patescibacteria group bacterium]
MTRKRVLVFNPPISFREIRRKLTQRVKLVRGYYRDVEICFEQNGITIRLNGIDLREFDFVWVSGSWSKRDIAHAISLYLAHYNRPHTIVSEGAGTSKLVDMVHYALHKLPQPKSYFCTNTEYLRRAEAIGEFCQFPLIAKDVKGTFGRKSFLANNLTELKQHLFSIDDTTDYIFQEFIPNQYDWGIIVGNGTILSAEKSYRNIESTAFMNHASAGAKEVFVPIEKVPKKIASLALKANNILSLQWARSDIVIDQETQKPYMLETNRSPRMTRRSTEVDAFATFINSFGV